MPKTKSAMKSLSEPDATHVMVAKPLWDAYNDITNDMTLLAATLLHMLETNKIVTGIYTQRRLGERLNSLIRLRTTIDVESGG